MSKDELDTTRINTAGCGSSTCLYTDLLSIKQLLLHFYLLLWPMLAQNYIDKVLQGDTVPAQTTQGNTTIKIKPEVIRYFETVE